MTFQYPIWYLLFCLLLGGVGAGLLYWGDKTFKEKSTWLHRLLAILRGLALSLIAALLLSPMLKTTIEEIKKPIIVVAQDQSESIGTIGDSVKYRSEINALIEKLGDKYDVQTYSFGDRVREGIDFSYKDKVSNIADVLKSTYDLYSTQNLGAVILATDGIYNAGANPIYPAAKLNAPVFSIALGDTTPKKDVVLKRVLHNNIAYLGDKFNIQIDLAANNCAGATTNVNIAKINAGNATNLQNANVTIDKNSFFTTKEITIEASQVGVQQFRVTASAVAGEQTTLNNTKDIFIEVLDARTKIVLLANAPHPDLAALSTAISTNKNYNVKIQYANEGAPIDADFVILHQLPSMTNGIDNIMATLNQKRTPRLFVVGTQSDVRKVSAQQSMVSLNANVNQTNDVQAILNPNFSLFTLEKDWAGVAQFPPLLSPFGDYKEITGGQTLLYQKIGKVDTKYPLLTLGESNNIRTGILTAEGIWKWRMFDFLQHQNQTLFDGLMSKTIQYLSVKEDKRKFRVSLEKNIFNENEPINMVAELYNNSYELVNDADARLVLTDEKSKQFNFNFNKSGRSYALALGILPVGTYNYRAAVNQNGQELTADGKFTVQPIQLELFETTANHSALYAMAQQSGGAVVTSNIAQLADMIQAKNTIKPVLYVTNKTQSVINLKWIFGLLLLLLAAEWFIRRYWGSY